MSPPDALLGLTVALVWGLTFIAIKYGVLEAPPFLLSALRFFFAAVPACFFVRPPRAPIRVVVVYGLLIGVGQFGLLFLSLKLGMPVGLASLVVQMQVFFTIALAALWLGERPTRIQLIAGALALAGIALIGHARFQGAVLLPFLLTLAASFCWGLGNLVGKFAGKVDAFAFTVWSSLVPPLPMLALSLALEDGRTLPALLHPSLRLAVCVAVIAYAGTLFGFGAWMRLLARYPAAMVAPFALLVPVVGMLAGWAIFHEPLSAIEFSGAILVMAGLTFNVVGERARALPSIPTRGDHA